MRVAGINSNIATSQFIGTSVSCSDISVSSQPLLSTALEITFSVVPTSFKSDPSTSSSSSLTSSLSIPPGKSKSHTGAIVGEAIGGRALAIIIIAGDHDPNRPMPGIALDISARAGEGVGHIPVNDGADARPGTVTPYRNRLLRGRLFLTLQVVHVAKRPLRNQRSWRQANLVEETSLYIKMGEELRLRCLLRENWKGESKIRMRSPTYESLIPLVRLGEIRNSNGSRRNSRSRRSSGRNGSKYL
ncbi:hypothetical protein C8J55DRAFT_518182 [Lentinula edodes]|uniref:Uncharacterized protein n=1 Tax=Lentinula lateritia TaxID=40482 RepID=A0A9W9A6B8_9AGAR|nr:hypothetical protein C8J55DRAFT_518182 [Lentinula edodes]